MRALSRSLSTILPARGSWSRSSGKYPRTAPSFLRGCVSLRRRTSRARFTSRQRFLESGGSPSRGFDTMECCPRRTPTLPTSGSIRSRYSSTTYAMVSSATAPASRGGVWVEVCRQLASRGKCCPCARATSSCVPVPLATVVRRKRRVRP